MNKLRAIGILAAALIVMCGPLSHAQGYDIPATVTTTASVTTTTSTTTTTTTIPVYKVPDEVIDPVRVNMKTLADEIRAAQRETQNWKARREDKAKNAFIDARPLIIAKDAKAGDFGVISLTGDKPKTPLNRIYNSRAEAMAAWEKRTAGKPKALPLDAIIISKTNAPFIVAGDGSHYRHGGTCDVRIDGRLFRVAGVVSLTGLQYIRELDESGPEPVLVCTPVSDRELMLKPRYHAGAPPSSGN